MVPECSVHKIRSWAESGRPRRGEEMKCDQSKWNSPNSCPTELRTELGILFGVFVFSCSRLFVFSFKAHRFRKDHVTGSTYPVSSSFSFLFQSRLLTVFVLFCFFASVPGLYGWFRFPIYRGSWWQTYAIPRKNLDEKSCSRIRRSTMMRLI